MRNATLTPILLTVLGIVYGLGYLIGQSSAKDRIDRKLIAAGVAYYHMHDATGEVTLIYGVKP